MKNKCYLLSEGVVSTATVYMVLKRLISPFNEWDAFALGLIDAEGNKLKNAISSTERDAWTVLDRFCCNLKKVLIKFVGQGKLANLITAVYLLRDDIRILAGTDKLLNEGLDNFTAYKQLQYYKLFEALDLIIDKEVDKSIDLDYYILKYNKSVERILETMELSEKDLL